MAARLTAYLVVFIVSATLIAGLIVGAQRDDNDGPVDLIVHNAVVYTAAGSGETAEAVAVRANQVLTVGSNREILRLQRPQTIMIDAKGGTVLPGFNDAHLHLIEGGLTLGGVDLSDAATVDEAVERVRAWADANPKEPWITGRGWIRFPSETPQTRQALDAITRTRPIFLLSNDGDAAWVNSKALKAAGIARRAKDPENGHIARDSRGEPTGILEGDATALVSTLLPEPTREERMQALLAAFSEAQRNGITSLQTTVDNLDDLELLDAARRSGAADMRVYSVLELDSPQTDDDIAKLDPVLERYAEDPLLKFGAVEVELDQLDADPLNRFVRLLDARGWQVSIEADTAAESQMARAAFAHAARSNPRAPRDRRHRLEHQAGHVTSVAGRIALGSDWPQGPLSPMSVMKLTKLGLRDALKAYTAGGAFASYDEQRKGTLEAGMLADLVVLSQDVFKVDRALLDTVKVAYTIFDGRVVFPAERRITYP
jgi:hypothetical protein